MAAIVGEENILHRLLSEVVRYCMGDQPYTQKLKQLLYIRRHTRSAAFGVVAGST
jgi:hypothetical protein